jgi:LPXTG-site transpeptidase (sortase) family protein
MHSRVFLFLLIGLSLLAAVTSPSLLKPFLTSEATPTATLVTETLTPTATSTPDFFDKVPIATPMGQEVAVFQRLSTPALGALPPTFTAGPALSPSGQTSLDLLTVSTALISGLHTEIPAPPTPGGPSPDRVYISRLERDLPVEPVGMVPSSVAPGVFEWDVPDHRAAGWLNTSAAFGFSGNTVLDGHHNIKGEAFRDLWTLQAGDEIVLYAGGQSRSYIVSEVLILPERNQPLQVRLANAQYIQPTTDERLTMITCWPYESNSHRVVVIALPNP